MKLMQPRDLVKALKCMQPSEFKQVIAIKWMQPNEWNQVNATKWFSECSQMNATKRMQPNTGCYFCANFLGTQLDLSHISYENAETYV